MLCPCLLSKSGIVATQKSQTAVIEGSKYLGEKKCAGKEGFDGKEGSIRVAIAPSGAKSSSPNEILKAMTGRADFGNLTLRISKKIPNRMIEVG